MYSSATLKRMRYSHFDQTLLTEQLIARKLIRASGNEVLNEIRAAEKLCGPGANRNIVPLFHHGRLANSHYYFLDMELCDLNLEDYIQRKWPSMVKEQIELFVNVDQLDSKSRQGQFWGIMRDIANGVAYIHSNGE